MPNVYEIVTDQVLEALNKGTVPWKQPWSLTTAPRNAKGRLYRGLNVFMLTVAQAAAGYESPVWLTFKQAKELGGSVRKGEHSTLVVFWKITKVVEDGESKTIPLLRYYRVFNLAQCDDVKLPKRTAEAVSADGPVDDTYEAVSVRSQAIVDAYTAADGPSVTYQGGNDRAFYRPATDSITMPPVDAFTSTSGRWETLFHELGHSTGHKSRLNRSGINEFAGFGSHPYGREELVAEMTSAFLLAEVGITNRMESTAGYLASWVRAIKEDTRAVVVAAGQAQKAADLILGREPEQYED